MAGYLHRTATTAYPCCVPTLGEFSRSWSCKTCRRKDRGMTVKWKGKSGKFYLKCAMNVLLFITSNSNKTKKPAVCRF